MPITIATLPLDEFFFNWAVFEAGKKEDRRLKRINKTKERAANKR
jgi:hypothetical protein